MPLFEPVIAERYFKPMLQALEHAPQSFREECVAAAGLTSADSFSPTAAITVDRFEAMLEVILQRPEYSAFGFDVGARLNVMDHGPLGPALLRCKTLDERIRLQAGYSRIITPVFSLSYQRFSDRAELIARPAAPFKPMGLRTILEIIAISFHSNLPSHLLDPLRPYHIHMPIGLPAHIARYKALTGVQFQFLKTGMPELKMVFPEAMLNIPLRTSSAYAAQDERRHLDLLKSQIGRTARCSEWARLILTEAEACQPTAQELADLLSVSRRTFERALTAEGVKYRDLARQVRHERACKQLTNPALSLSQIAYNLGYGELAAFSRAFSALAGTSASEYRKNLQRHGTVFNSTARGRTLSKNIK